jgi:prevent-host-death family protein
MKQISINELQSKLSKIIKEVESGEAYRVNRYSKTVAFLLPEKEFEGLVSGSSCKKCMEDLREIKQSLTNKMKKLR